MRDAMAFYRDVPAKQRERLFTFRAAHPYHQVTVNGAAWRYLACGQGEKTLLLLPGAFLKADMWLNQILALEKEYRIIAPDAFPLQGIFEMEPICDALLESLDAEGIEQATVIGISAGGGVAQYLLQTRAESVKHAVFSHCGVLERTIDAETKAKRILSLVSLLPTCVIRRVLRRMTTGKMPPSSPWIAFHEAYLDETLPNIRRSMVVGFLRSSLQTRRAFAFQPDALDAWPGSLLILSSKDDVLSQSSVENLQRRYPRAQTKWLEKGGHHTFLLFPEAYTTVLRRFLAVTS